VPQARVALTIPSDGGPSDALAYGIDATVQLASK
jgi:hypothetical protein